MNGSQITLIGNLTADPVLRTSNAGNDWATFRVAVNRFVKDGEESEPMFYDIKVFKSLAANVCASLSKGDRVVIVGDGPYLRTYTDSQGEERSSFEVIADAIGPELRFAQASISRTGGSSGNNSRPARSGGQARSGGAELPGYGSATSTGVDDNPFAPTGGGYDPNDEPF